MIGGETAVVLEIPEQIHIPVAKIQLLKLLEKGAVEEPKKKEQGVHYG